MRRLSIITINYNNAEGLLKTVSSVLNQTYTNIEYIIVDGASTDLSVEIIKQNADRISAWVSEKDRGVYHAMNKGISLANGEYLLFLNSGDYLAGGDVLDKVFSKFPVDVDIVYGDLLLEENGRIIREKKYPDTISFKYFFHNESLPHPSSLIKRSLFEKVGYYNENLKIASDFEFWLQAIFLHRVSYARLPIPISVFNLEGASSKPENVEILKTERKKIYDKYFPDIVKDYEEFDAFRDGLQSSRYLRLLNKFRLFKFW